MSITEIPALDRTSATFKADLNTLFGVTIPTFSVELNAEIDRLNTLGAGSYSGTSTTSLAIGTGEKALTIGTGKGFVTGQYVSVTDSANAANYMRGPVKTYNSGTGALVVTVDSIGGSGTKTAWSVGLQAAVTAPTQVYSTVLLTTGTTWTCPDGIRAVKAYLIGGGTGYYHAATGNGGGQPSGPMGVVIIPVSGGASYTYAIGAGGTSGAGGASIFVASGLTYSSGSASNGVVICPGNAGTATTAAYAEVTVSRGPGHFGFGSGAIGDYKTAGQASEGSNGAIILELHK